MPQRLNQRHSTRVEISRHRRHRPSDPNPHGRWLHPPSPRLSPIPPQSAPPEVNLARPARVVTVWRKEAPREAQQSRRGGRSRRAAGPVRRRLQQVRRFQRIPRRHHAHLLGEQPGHEPGERQAVLQPGARQVRDSRPASHVKLEVDRLGRPAQPDPGRDHLGSGTGRAQHRQHLVGLVAGDRRAPALRRRKQLADRRQGPVRRPAAWPRPARRGSHRGRAAVLAGVRPLLQQEDVRRRRHSQAAGDLGRTGRGRQEAHQRPDSGGWRSRAATAPRTPTTPSSSASSTARDLFDAGRQARRSTPPGTVAGDQAVHGLHGRRQDRQPEQRGVREEPVRRPTSPPARPRC